MNREDIEQWTREAGGFDATPEFLAKFAALVASAERQACTDLLMGLHEAQSNNGNHNYYHYAANAIKELRKQA